MIIALYTSYVHYEWTTLPPLLHLHTLHSQFDTTSTTFHVLKSVQKNLSEGQILSNPIFFLPLFFVLGLQVKLQMSSTKEEN